MATVVLGLHARKCCFGPLGGGGVSPPVPPGASEAVDTSEVDVRHFDFLNFMPYYFVTHFGLPLFSLFYSPQCEAIIGGGGGGLFACPGPGPDPKCPLFTALAVGAAVQTANIIYKRKKIKNQRRQLEVKPEACQYNQESPECFCALYPDISGCRDGQKTSKYSF